MITKLYFFVMLIIFFLIFLYGCDVRDYSDPHSLVLNAKDDVKQIQSADMYLVFDNQVLLFTYRPAWSKIQQATLAGDAIKYEVNFRTLDYAQYVKQHREVIRHAFKLSGLESIQNYDEGLVVELTHQNNKIQVFDGEFTRQVPLYENIKLGAKPVGNSKILYISVPNCKITLSNGFMSGTDQINISVVNNEGDTSPDGLLVWIEEFSEENVMGNIVKKWKSRRKEYLVKGDFGNIDYICNSPTGLRALADYLGKRIVATEYPFLYKLEDMVTPELAEEKAAAKKAGL